MLRTGLAGALFVFWGAFSTPAAAENVYQEPEAFIAEAFAGQPPDPQVLWLTGALRDEVEQILGHAPDALRIRFWARAQRSTWILEELGKERPITVGVVVAHNAIEHIKVLVFRETRGWEVRYPFFTDQFQGARLTDRRQLDRSIDGISGATLSVRALKKIAQVALLLHRQAIGSP